MEKFGISMLKQTKPILSDLGTYLTKVRGDVKKMVVLGGRDHKIEDTPPPPSRGFGSTHQFLSKNFFL